MKKKLVFASIFISSLFVVVDCSPICASLLDKRDVEGRMDAVQTIYMLEPQIILGRRDEKHALYEGDAPGTKMAQRAILQAADDAFGQQGYRLISALDDYSVNAPSNEYQARLKAAWTHLDLFADAGREKKPKFWPFSISPDHQQLTPNHEVDAIAFVQCYGKFDSLATPDAQVPGAIASTVIQVALVGSALIYSGDYSILEFKLSLIDPKTGELIFYRESLEDDTDVRDKTSLTSTFTKAFKWYLPKAVNPAPIVKFKKKRSEIMVESISGGSNAVQAE